MKSSGPCMDLSTWLSAAKLTTARGRYCASNLPCRVADVALHEHVTLISFQGSEILQIAGVSQLVQADHALIVLREPIQDEIGADETCTAGNQNHVVLPHPPGCPMFKRAAIIFDAFRHSYIPPGGRFKLMWKQQGGETQHNPPF